MDQESLRGIILEIMDYIENTNNYSYYDLEAYAYSQKQEWIPVFKDRNTRTMIAECLRSKKRMKKATYKTPKYEAMRRSTEVKYQYAVQREKDFFDQIDALVDNIESEEQSD